MKKIFLFIGLSLGIVPCIFSATGGILTRPGGSNGQVQYNNNGTFGGTYDVLVSTIRFTDGTTQYTAGGAGSGSGGYALEPSTITPNFQYGFSASTGVFTSTITLSDGTILYSTSQFSGSSGGGYAIEPATVTIQADRGISISTTVLPIDEIPEFPGINQDSKFDPGGSLFNRIQWNRYLSHYYRTGAPFGYWGGYAYDVVVSSMRATYYQIGVATDTSTSTYGILSGLTGIRIEHPASGANANAYWIVNGSPVLYFSGSQMFFPDGKTTKHIVGTGGSTKYMTLQPPASLTATGTWTWPDFTGISGYWKTTSGGVLSVSSVSWNHLTDVPAGFADGTDDTSAGGGDNLGNHIATMTITAGYGIEASTVSVGTLTVTSDIVLPAASIEDAALSANVSLLGSQIDIGSESNLAAEWPIKLTDDTVSISSAPVFNEVTAGTMTVTTSATFQGPATFWGNVTFNGVDSMVLDTDVTITTLTVTSSGTFEGPLTVHGALNTPNQTHQIHMVADLAGAWDIDHEWPLMWVQTAKYPNGVIISSWTVQANTADPATELTANLRYCNDNGLGAFPGASATLIDVLDTTTGNSSETNMALSDLGSGVIPVGKKIYLELDADPADATTFYELTIFYRIP